ncbi:MAG: OB-fold nucleic acid binding domain-containing protein, partial [Acutalibacteraceae bacterium]|nr:OB-fold nucleic acid binding domain-containing protein [Acutalibacteraceae bacterium]
MALDRMDSLKRTHYCGTLSTEDEGSQVIVCGWAQRQRDLGGLIFIDLRDRTGILQLAFDDNTEKSVFEKASSVRSEFVLMAQGKVRRRSSVNKDIPTGEIEIEVTTLKILGKSETPPFDISNDTKANEELRLKYRYLDLRREKLQRHIITRHRIAK